MLDWDVHSSFASIEFHLSPVPDIEPPKEEGKVAVLLLNPWQAIMEVLEMARAITPKIQDRVMLGVEFETD